MSNQYTFRLLVATPSGCTIKLNDVERTSIKVSEGEIVTWEVSKEGYLPDIGEIKLESNYSISIDLNSRESKKKHYYTKWFKKNGKYVYEKYELTNNRLPPTENQDGKYLKVGKFGFLQWSPAESGKDVEERLTKLEEGKADKATTLAGYNIADAYTKDEVDAKVSSVYKYKGSVETYNDLPTEGMEVGDVYNIKKADKSHNIKAGDNVAWTGSEWDVLAGTFDLTEYAKKEEVNLLLEQKADKSTTYSKTETDALIEAEASRAKDKEAELNTSITTEVNRAKGIEEGLASDIETMQTTLESKADKTEIPTKVSELENDAGYLTEHQDISNLATKAEVIAETTRASTAENQLMTEKANKEEMDGKLSFKLLNKLDDYLYEIEYYSTDPSYAKKYFEENFRDAPSRIFGSPKMFGQCSSLKNGNFYGRNYDWFYDKASIFFVRTLATQDKHAVMGLSALLPLKDDFVKTREYSELYQVVPYALLDGINDAGLVANTNVIHLNDFRGNPDGICAIQGVSEVLYRFDNAEEAANWLKDNYWVSDKFANYSFHVMIADKNKTFIVEDGQAIDVTNTTPYMTNFRVAQNFVVDNQVDYDVVAAHDLYGAGLERMNLILSQFENCNTHEGMRNTLESIKYSNMYKILDDKQWLSELCGDYGETKIDLNSIRTEAGRAKALEVLAEQAEIFKHRSREDANTWHTVHSSIYDLEKKVVHFVVQEEDVSKEKTFYFNISNYIDEQDSKKADKENTYTKTEVDAKISSEALFEKGTGEHSIQTKGTMAEAAGDYSFAEGFDTHAMALKSHAEGENTKVFANAEGAHAEGIGTNAKGMASHVEGQLSVASGDCSHAEGNVCSAVGMCSHAEGNNTTANNMFEHAEGHWNYSNKTSDIYGNAGNTIHSIGVGKTLMERKNAVEVMQNGDTYILGVGNYNGANFSEADTLQTVVNAKADKATTLADYGITDAYTKTEVDAKVSGVYHFRGTVVEYADLPTDGMQIGDVWNIVKADKAHDIKAGDNVAWDGEHWDVLAGKVDLSAYRTSADQDVIDNTLKAKDTELEEGLAGKEDADPNIVKYKDFTYEGQDRKTIQLANNNTISGIDTDGKGHNLAMLSQWNVADFGSKDIHTNLNTIPYNGINAVSVNDTDVVLTDKLLGMAMLPADDTITITPDTITVEGIDLTVNKLHAKQYDDTEIKETIAEAVEDAEYAINSLNNRVKPLEKFKEGALDTLVIDNPNDPITIVNNFEGTSFFVGEEFVDEQGNITLENKLISQIDYSTMAHLNNDVTITLKNCIIDYNQYVKPSSEGVHNGGVYIVDGHTNPDYGVNIIIQNCVFKNLRNKAHGVAIQGCIQKKGVSQVSNLKTVDIRGNTFEIYDGAVASAGRGCLKIWGTTFDQIGVLPGGADQGSRPLYDYIENVERKNVLESLCYANNFYGLEPYVTKFALYDTKGNSLIYMMKGATETKDGLGGLVPPPTMADKDKFLKGNGTWEAVDLSNLATKEELSPINADMSALLARLNSLENQLADLKKADIDLTPVITPVTQDGGKVVDVTDSTINYVLTGNISGNDTSALIGKSITMQDMNISGSSTSNTAITLKVQKDIEIKDSNLTGNKSTSSDLLYVGDNETLILKNLNFDGNTYNTLMVGQMKGTIIYPKNVLIDNCNFDETAKHLNMYLSGLANNCIVTISNCHFKSAEQFLCLGDSAGLNKITVNIFNCVIDNYEHSEGDVYSGIIYLDARESGDLENFKSLGGFSNVTLNLSNVVAGGVKLTEDNFKMGTKDKDQMLYVYHVNNKVGTLLPITDYEDYYPIVNIL